MDKLKEVQLAFDDNGEIVEEPLHDETLEAEIMDVVKNNEPNISTKTIEVYCIREILFKSISFKPI